MPPRSTGSVAEQRSLRLCRVLAPGHVPCFDRVIPSGMTQNAPRLLDIQVIQRPRIVAHDVLPDSLEGRDRFRYLQVLCGDVQAGEGLDLERHANLFVQSVQGNVQRDRLDADRPRHTRRPGRELDLWRRFWGLASKRTRLDADWQAQWDPEAQPASGTPQRLPRS